MKKHCFIPRFRYSVAALPITSITLRRQESKSNLSQKTRRSAWNCYLSDWTSAPHISLRSGMFKHPNVVPITAAKLDSKQQLKQEPIPPIRTGAVTRSAIRHMLAAAQVHGTRTPCKILYMLKRSPDDSCKT
jgi:hypothetical protein